MNLALAGTRLYVVDNVYFTIIDVSNPSAPLVLGTYSDSIYSGVQGIDATDSLVFLAIPTWSHLDPDAGVYIVDVTNDAQPILLKKIMVPGLTRSVIAAGNSIYAGDGDAVIDVISLQ